MSQDPYGYSSDVPPPPADAAIREQVKMPAIFLIIVAVINLFFVAYEFVNTLFIVQKPAADYFEQMRTVYKMIGLPNVLDGQTPEGLKAQSVAMSALSGGIGLVVSLVILLGAVQMLRLRSWGLSMAGAILAVIPCITCSGCCGLGEGIGIWAMVVLVSEPVKAAFARAAGPGS